MERQHLYERQNFGQGIGGGGVAGARVLDAPKNQNPLFDLFMRAIDTGKTAVQAGAKEYDRRQRLHIEDAVNKVNAEMDAWELEYMKTHQGADALTAQRDFADKFQELSQQAINDYGGDDYYRNLLGREFVKPAMYAIKRGTQYQYQQDELWQKSVFDGTMSNIQQGVWQNADDSDHVESLIQRGEQAIRDRFPGQDVTARINEFREKMMADQVNSLIENNRLPEAQAALDRLGGGSAQPAGGIAPGVSSGPRGHTIAEDFHNPLNLKKVGGGSGRAAFRQFADDAEGFRGAYHQLKLYYNRDGLKTPRQMISKWAPSFENNHPEYFGTIRKHGINIDAPIDMNDPKQAARLVKAMATHEGPLGKRYSFEQIEGFLRGQGPDGIQPGATAQSESIARSSASPRLAALQSRLDAARKRDLEQDKKAQEATLAQNIQGVVTSLGDLDPDQRKAAVYAQLDKITDPEQRKNAISIANREIEFQDKKQKAQRAFAVSSLVQQARQPNVSPAQQEEMVLKSGLNEEDQKDALKRIRGEVKTNELNMRATAAMRRQIDEARQNGQPMDDDSIFRFYRDNMLTQAQLEELIKYRDEGGKGGHVTQSQVNNIWRDLQGEMGEKKKADDAPAELYGAVLKLLPDGRKATYDDIRKAVSQAIVKGRVSGFIWDSSYTRAEAMAKGKIDKWRSEEESKNEYVY